MCVQVEKNLAEQARVKGGAPAPEGGRAATGLGMTDVQAETIQGAGRAPAPHESKPGAGRGRELHEQGSGDDGGGDSSDAGPVEQVTEVKGQGDKEFCSWDGSSSGGEQQCTWDASDAADSSGDGHSHEAQSRDDVKCDVRQTDAS